MSEEKPTPAEPDPYIRSLDTLDLMIEILNKLQSDSEKKDESNEKQVE